MHNHHCEAPGGARSHHPHGRGTFNPHGMKGPFGKSGFGPHGMGSMIAQRVRRGDVRTAILRLLAEQPMHGYQIIQELSARSDGAWTPSPGSVYPTLQLLADEDLIVAEETGGKKVFSLTESGTAAAAELADEPAPWDAAAQSGSGAQGLREAARLLAPVIWQVGTSGSAEQTKRAVEVLTDARKQLYSMLAEG